jgi:probable HAF family extracellular repeat protein
MAGCVRFARIYFLFFISLLSVSAVSASSARYLLTDLGTTGVDTAGWSVGRDGTVLAKTNVDPSLGQAFIWQNGAPAFLNVPGDTSVAWAISSSGVIGGSYGFTSTGERDAFLMQNGALTTLSPLPGATVSEVLNVSDSNQIVGYSGGFATTWVGGQAVQIPGAGSPSAAWGVNYQGTVVGETPNPSGTGNVPFIYQGGLFRLLPYPVGSDFDRATALSINDAGHIAGYGVILQAVHCAVLWRGSQTTLLANDAEALCINNKDQIVGRSPAKSPYYGEAVIWNNTVMTNLNDQVIDLQGLHLIQARSINDDGKIVGIAQDITRQYHGFLLTPVAEVASLEVDPNPVQGGRNGIGTLTLDRPAPAGGETVNLLSLAPSIATVPAWVVIPAGATIATFPVTTQTVTHDTSVTIEAGVYNLWKSTALLVVPSGPRLDTFFLSSNTVYSAQPLTGTVTLREVAPSGGIKVTLTNSNPAVATVPTSVTVPQGQISKSFNITTAAAPTVSLGTIIKATYGTVTLQQSLTVAPIVLQSLQLSTGQVTGGIGLTGVVHTPVAAPSAGYKVTLTCSNPGAATVPVTVTIPHGASSASFTVTTKPVTGTTFLTITARTGSSGLSAQLIVLPPEVLTFSISPTSVRGGSNATGKVTLTGKAATGGVAVNIQTSSGQVIPASNVRVSAGSNSVSFVLATSAVASTTPVVVMVRTFSVQKSAILTLTH